MGGLLGVQMSGAALQVVTMAVTTQNNVTATINKFAEGFATRMANTLQTAAYIGETAAASAGKSDAMNKQGIKENNDASQTRSV